MNTPRSSTETLIAALRVLARDIQSDDGVANAAIAEAADRLEEFRNLCDAAVEFWRISLDFLIDSDDPKYEKAGEAAGALLLNDGDKRPAACGRSA